MLKNLSYKDPKIGSWNRSNKITRHKSKCFDVTYQFNNIGARDNKSYEKSTFKKSHNGSALEWPLTGFP